MCSSLEFDVDRFCSSGGRERAHPGDTSHPERARRVSCLWGLMLTVSASQVAVNALIQAIPAILNVLVVCLVLGV